MSRMRAEIKSGDRFLALFLIWYLKHSPAHGYNLISEVRDIGFSPRRQSTVYLLLSKLEKSGAIKGRDVRVGKRLRRFYKTTSKGSCILQDVKDKKIKGKLREFMEFILSR